MEGLFLHICCAPCLIYPLSSLKKEGWVIKGYFYNPNIHPLDEFNKRKDTLKYYSGLEKLDIIFDDYDIELYFDRYRKDGDRCEGCYRVRLEKTAIKAKELGFHFFSTTLLYSIRQKHELIKRVGKEIEEIYNIKFYYRDFRIGWKEGIQKSKDIGLYRQNYCGCIFSHKERFYR